ncbi:MAG TPA: DUF4838 domain-containing protein [Candidatus Brocadiia bacterium]|nr:DUF4838 domain-containing protein [Candidatus Brocadiia bacterium]
MNKMKAVVAALCLLHAGMACSAGAEAMKIASAGKPLALIVTPDTPTETESLAAQELRDYVQKITGATLQIIPESKASASSPRLIVGAVKMGATHREALRGLDLDAFLVKTAKQIKGGFVGADWDDAEGRFSDLFLAGATDRATLYAVYDFLERELGCRWLGPGPDWEDIPRNPSVTLPDVDRVETPGIKYRLMREMGGVNGAPGSNEAYCVSWGVKNKLNIGYTYWPGEATPAGYRETRNPPIDFRGWLSPHSGPRVFLPADLYFKQRPEWYATLPDGSPNPRQFCTTNPGLIEAMAKRISEMFNQRPSVEFICLGVGDGHTMCQCANCKALDKGRLWREGVPDYTPRVLAFVNAVAGRLAVTNPGKKLVYLAYHSTTRPPDETESKPAANVMVELATWSPIGCRMHTIACEDCRPHAQFREVYKRWRAITPAGMLIYEYLPRGSCYEMPFIAPRRFASDIRYLQGQGLAGYEAQTVRWLWGTYGVTKYAVAKALWNPQLDADALVKDYCDRAFREASEPMQRFIAAAEAAQAAAECNWGSLWNSLTPEALAQGRKHLDAAHAAAGSDLVRKRLRGIEISWRMAEMTAPAMKKASGAQEAKNPALLNEAIAEAQAAIRFIKEESAREPHFAGGTYRLEKSVKDWEKALKDMRQP